VINLELKKKKLFLAFELSDREREGKRERVSKKALIYLDKAE